MNWQAAHVNAICVLLSLAFLISPVECILKIQICFFFSCLLHIAWWGKINEQLLLSEVVLVLKSYDEHFKETVGQTEVFFTIKSPMQAMSACFSKIVPSGAKFHELHLAMSQTAAKA
uniref:Uncharacterized protein n=1 Tax=Rhipicephalus appendiculatus TaxID=34631 RepID=A0A131YE98_RHIAP